MCSDAVKVKMFLPLLDHPADCLITVQHQCDVQWCSDGEDVPPFIGSSSWLRQSGTANIYCAFPMILFWMILCTCRMIIRSARGAGQCGSTHKQQLTKLQKENNTLLESNQNANAVHIYTSQIWTRHTYKASLWSDMKSGVCVLRPSDKNWHWCIWSN